MLLILFILFSYFLFISTSVLRVVQHLNTISSASMSSSSVLHATPMRRIGCARCLRNHSWSCLSWHLRPLWAKISFTFSSEKNLRITFTMLSWPSAMISLLFLSSAGHSKKRCSVLSGPSRHSSHSSVMSPIHLPTWCPTSA